MYPMGLYSPPKSNQLIGRWLREWDRIFSLISTEIQGTKNIPPQDLGKDFRHLFKLQNVIWTSLVMQNNTVYFKAQ